MSWVALSKMEIALAGTLVLVEPAAALMWGLVLFGEVPTPLMVVGGIGVCNAATISPSVMLSQRQMILPGLSLPVMRGLFLVLMKLSFSFNSSPSSASMPTTYSPIAGAAVRPGDFMQAMSMKRGYFSLLDV